MKNTMKLLLLVTNTDGTTHEHYGNFADFKSAHEWAKEHFTTSVVKVYPVLADENGVLDTNALALASMMVVKRTLANCCKREGTTAQHRLYGEAVSYSIKWVQKVVEEATENIKCFQACDTRIASQDLQDLASVCTLALIEAVREGHDIATQYRLCYKAINKYLYDNRGIRLDDKPMHFSLDRLIEQGVDIVNISKGIAQLVNPEEVYTVSIEDRAEQVVSNKTASAFIKALVRITTPVQREILKYLALGYSQPTIEKKTGRSHATICEHIVKIRAKAVELASTDYPEILELYSSIRNDNEVNTIVAKGNKADRHKTSVARKVDRHTSKADRHKNRKK